MRITKSLATFLALGLLGAAAPAQFGMWRDFETATLPSIPGGCQPAAPSNFMAITGNTQFYQPNQNGGFWRVCSGSPPNGVPGPAGDHTTGSGKYILLDDFCGPVSGAGYEITLDQIMGISIPPGATLRFWIWSPVVGGGVSILRDDPTGLNLWSGLGWYHVGAPVANQWTQVSLTNFDPTPATYLRIECSTAGIAIDDMEIVDLPKSWETNSSEADLTINGVTVSHPFSLTPAIAVLGPCSTWPGYNEFLLSSDVPNTYYEVAINTVPLISGSDPNGFVHADGQVVNIDLAGATWMNGGTGLVLAPMPAPPPFTVLGASIRFLFTTPPPGLTSIQAVLLDPAAPLGFQLTQGTEVDSASGAPTLPGPTSDDGGVLVDVTAPPFCLSSGIEFYGQTYTQIGVNSNGRVTMGGTSSDWSPTLAEAAAGMPFIGYWTDLSPNLGGSIDIVGDQGPNPNTIDISWTSVPFYGEPATGSSFTISVSEDGTAALSGLSGIQANPETNGWQTGDSAFMGISPGGGAIDPGSTLFAAGSNAPPTPQSLTMIYDFHVANTLGSLPGMPVSLGFSANPPDVITFSWDTSGWPDAYSWSAQ